MTAQEKYQRLSRRREAYALACCDALLEGNTKEAKRLAAKVRAMDAEIDDAMAAWEAEAAA